MAEGKKWGGRKKGQKNLVTTQVKQSIQYLIEGSLEELRDDMKALSPKDRINAVTGLLKYVIPTLKAQDITLDTQDTPPRWVTDILNDEYDPSKYDDV